MQQRFSTHLQKSRGPRSKSGPLLTLFIALGLLGFASCSLFSDREPVGEGPADVSGETVPREQYEQLRQEYEKLRYQLTESGGTMEIASDSWDEQEQMTNELNQIESSVASESSPGQLGGTVDVFDREREAESAAAASRKQNTRSTEQARRPVVQAGTLRHNYNEVDVEGQIARLRQASQNIESGNYDAAMSELRALESSPVRQISVRARFYMGELLFAQQEYDLALQSFEEILKRDAFSGLVIKTLDRLVTCSENLGLEEKRQQYHSLLHDFFES